MTAPPPPSGPATDLRRAASADEVHRWLVDLLGPELVGGDGDLLADLGWDSLTLAEVAIAAEVTFQSELPDELLVELRTIGDVVHYVCQTGGRHTGTGEQPVALVPVTHQDEPMLFDWFTTPGHLDRYRLRSVTPSSETLHRVLWDNVVSQYLVCRADGVAAGLVTCFEPDFRNRHAHLAAIANPALTGTTALQRGLALFVSSVFDSFDFRKLYAQVLDCNLSSVASGLGRVCRHEGVLAEHEYLGGQYRDLHLIAVYRHDWQAGPFATAASVTAER